MKWPQSIYWKRIVLTVSAVSMAYVLSCLKWIPYRNTVYGDGFRKGEFYRVVRNQTIDQVYRIIGPPLFCDVKLDASGTRAYNKDYGVALENVRDFVQTNTDAYLEYSAPRAVGKCYVLYYVDFGNGRVRKCGRLMFPD